VKLGGYHSLRCIAHSIQLSIKDAFKNSLKIQELVNKCKSIVKYFKKSGPAMNTLINIQSLKRGTNVLKLLQDVSTRLNSEFYMIYRILELKQPLCTAISQIDGVDEISKDEWKILDELVTVLDVLEGSTRVLCGDSYSTLSMFIPTINLLIEHNNEKFLNHPDVINFRDFIITSIKERFKEAENNKCALISTLLDPRFKKSINFNILFLNKVY
jgi:hypothetical protein